MTVEERNKIFDENIKLVYYTLSKYHPMFAQSEDAFQEGCIALLDAIDGYKPELGTFSSYAIKSIIRRVHKMCYSKQQKFNAEIPISSMLKENSQGDIETDEEFITSIGYSVDGIEEHSSIKRIDIMGTLKHLPVPDAFMLYEILNGKSQIDIADEMRTTRQNVSRRLLLAEEKFKFFWNKK